MADWGLCKDCKWFQVEPDAKVSDDTLGMCIDDTLIKFELRVSGDSGCNYFMEGEVARAKGSSDGPPTAKATR